MAEDRMGDQDVRGIAVYEELIMQEGDIVEFTLKGERRTAEVMLVTMDDVVLLDLFDGDRLAWARLALLEGLAIFRPDLEVSAAA